MSQVELSFVIPAYNEEDAIEPIRIVLLAVLGCLFSLLMLMVLLKPANSRSS